MDLSAINWLAVFVAALAFLGLAAIWHGVLFRKSWLAGVQLSAQEIGDDYYIKVALSSLIMGLVIATGVAVLLESYWVSTASDIVTGMSLGMLCGIFFLFPSISMSYILARRPISLVLIEAFFYLLSYTVIGMIVGGWR